MEDEIRRIRASERSLLGALRLRALEADPSSFGSTYAREAAFPDEEWAGWAASHASGEDMATLLAIRRGEPVGIVAAYRDPALASLFHVMSMWVAPEARREGLGRRLLREVEDWIAKCGGKSIQLDVTDIALAASRLYATAGYAPDGGRSDSPHTPGLTHVSLRKDIALAAGRDDVALTSQASNWPSVTEHS